MNDTLRLWNDIKAGKYEIVLSDVTLRETYKCKEPKLSNLVSFLNEVNYSLIETNKETLQLAEKFIDFGILK